MTKPKKTIKTDGAIDEKDLENVTGGAGLDGVRAQLKDIEGMELENHLNPAATQPIKTSSRGRTPRGLHRG